MNESIKKLERVNKEFCEEGEKEKKMNVREKWESGWNVITLGNDYTHFTT